MNQLPQRIRSYLTNTDININERLGVFFAYIGIAAAFLGVVICILAHTPASGTISVALIALTAPLIAGITRHAEHPEHFGSIIAILIIIMIPIVWLVTGSTTGGAGFWMLYELFYITLFAGKKQLIPYYIAAVLAQAAAIAIEWTHPELFFHFVSRSDAYISKIGSAVVVTTEILVTVLVQKTLYVHEREINTKSEDITRNFVTSIANTIDTKDPYTGGHSRRVAECASAIALKLGMSQAEADNMYFVGLLHDIGKIGVPDSVLNKPGRLTDEEFAMIRRHPVYGAEILKDLTAVPHVHDGALYHHERYDGKGYPEGLKGEEIPYVARIISVADSYDAMSTNRVYRKRLKREEIINEMIRCRGTQFDPHIVDVFVEMQMEGFCVSETADTGSSGYSLAAAVSEMMRSVMEDEKLIHQKSGATNVANLEFVGLYDYLRNLCLRNGSTMVLTNIYLNINPETEDSARLTACMSNLHQAITRNIRSADICTRETPTSYLVLLMNAPYASIDLIIDRISRDFYSLQGNTNVQLCHSIIEKDA